MCELLGISSARPIDAVAYLKTFYAHSVLHPHGWGLMYESGGERMFLREAVRAVDSTYLEDVITSLEPQKTLLGHIRLATVGTVCEENCHPFTGRDMTGREWTLIHNGTIYSGKLNYQYYKRQRGDTDSERVFLALLDAVNEGSSITVIISDNSTTGMTGGQQSSATGRIIDICKGIGVDPEHIKVITPLKKNLDENVRTIAEELKHNGVSVIIPQRECIQTASRKAKAAAK